MTYVGIGGGQNTYVPGTNWSATGLLQAEYTRTQNSFALTKYAQLVPVNASSGWYPRINPVDAFRISSANQNRWAEGSDAPTGKDQQVEWVQYTTARYAYPFQFSTKTAQQAAWDIVASHARQKAQLAMTDRARAVITALTTSGNWPTGNYFATAGAVTGGGSWSSSSTTERYIEHTIRGVCQAISKATGGVVGPKDINLVINPVQASNMAMTAEIQAYVVNNVNTINYQTGDEMYDLWGLPKRLFGVNVVVEDTVINTSIQGASSQTQGYVLGDAVAVFTTRIGGVVENQAGPTLTTVQVNAFEDMTVEQMDDTWNRTVKGRVVQDFAVTLPANLSGAYIASTAS